MPFFPPLVIHKWTNKIKNWLVCCNPVWTIFKRLLVKDQTWRNNYSKLRFKIISYYVVIFNRNRKEIMLKSKKRFKGETPLLIFIPQSWFKTQNKNIFGIGLDKLLNFKAMIQNKLSNLCFHVEKSLSLNNNSGQQFISKKKTR